MPKLYMITDPAQPLVSPNYTTSEWDASMASIKGKNVQMTEVHWQVMSSKVTFAPVEKGTDAQWSEWTEEDNYG